MKFGRLFIGLAPKDAHERVRFVIANIHPAARGGCITLCGRDLWIALNARGRRA